MRNKKLDKYMVNILMKNYSDVFFWPQGYSDYQYAVDLGIINRVKIINPNLEAMHKILLSGDIDYVGTRLHGGIYAIQHKVRSIILSIDNRAREMKENYNIPTLEREMIEQLDSVINSLSFHVPYCLYLV